MYHNGRHHNASNTTNDAPWDLWDGEVQDPMNWLSSKNEHQSGQFQVGVREEAN
jgi:hypothetical protein